MYIRVYGCMHRSGRARSDCTICGLGLIKHPAEILSSTTETLSSEKKSALALLPAKANDSDQQSQPDDTNIFSLRARKRYGPDFQTTLPGGCTCLICRVIGAVMVFNTDPHFIKASLHQRSETSCLEYGRS